MWVMTRFGFFSVVQKTGESGLTIRARVREDLERLRDEGWLPRLGEIHADAGTDYQFRAHASRADFAEALRQIALGIDYDNFKNTVHDEQGSARARVYGKVWDLLWELTKGE
ncbi:MAG: hypothetical protein KA184_03980 [Candidatus Hydrogenedentes bacterium]|nr:hypothetical protein [Candidatus Hydrogenedentota bacterium]